MAAIANTIKERAASGLFDWMAGTIGALILNETQATNRDFDFVSSLSGEIAGAGYSRKTLTNRSRSRNDTLDIVICTADALQWIGINAGLADRMVLFVEAASDAERRIISYHNIRDVGGNPVTTNGGDLTMPPSQDYGYFTVVDGQAP